MIPGRREAIMVALTGLVAQVGVLAMPPSRRLLFWSSVATQPAGFVRHLKDQYERRGVGDRIVRVTMLAEVWFYLKNSAEPDVIPDTQLNAIVDAFEAQIEPLRGPQTLGGLCQWCWIDGDIDYAPGDTADQSLVRIPITILVTGGSAPP